MYRRNRETGMSTIESGNEFRDQIAELLRISGFSPDVEILIGHKAVDIVFEQEYFGKAKKIAVECKNYAKPLNKTDLEHIYGGYATLIQQGQVDEILVVSPLDLTAPAAKAFSKSTKSFTFITYRGLQESIIGFENYLRDFCRRHEESGLENYFIPPASEQHNDVTKYISAWLESNDNTPLAIIASYGMGKTTLAEHICFHLASAYLSGGTGRIPILIRLGLLSKEQTLEGLIGKVLVGDRPFVKNFSFPLFKDLNKIGRFIIFLDGFDEMKYCMTEWEFQENFFELNRLVEGRSKVILLGRPNAFLSDDERSFVLKADMRGKRSSFNNPKAVRYNEINLRPFSFEDTKKFIENYYGSKLSEMSSRGVRTAIQRRIRSTDFERQKELLSRPIHAKIMAELISDPYIKLDQFNKFTLYDEFLTSLMSRERTKSNRIHTPKRERHSFLYNLAWFIWSRKDVHSLAFRLSDLPNELFSSSLRVENDEIDDRKRDLLSGSFIEEKTPMLFYFPHRSFHEFLVSCYIFHCVSKGIELNQYYKNDQPEDGEEAIYDDYDYSGIETLSGTNNEIIDFLYERYDFKFYLDFSMVIFQDIDLSESYHDANIERLQYFVQLLTARTTTLLCSYYIQKIVSNINVEIRANIIAKMFLLDLKVSYIESSSKESQFARRNFYKESIAEMKKELLNLEGIDFRVIESFNLDCAVEESFAIFRQDPNGIWSLITWIASDEDESSINIDICHSFIIKILFGCVEKFTKSYGAANVLEIMQDYKAHSREISTEGSFEFRIDDFIDFIDGHAEYSELIYI